MANFRAYELATTSLSIRSSGEKAGFGFQRRDETTYLFVHEGKTQGIA
jgi:hypothetical protein